MRILILDSQSSPNNSATLALQAVKEPQFDLDVIDNETEFLSKAAAPEYTALLINLAEPEGARLGLIEQLRGKKIFTPALAFGGSPEALPTALENGYDDYVGKDASPDELPARLKALVRRAAYGQEPTRINAGNIALDLLKRQVRRGDKLIELQPREFAMLEYMIRNQDRPLSKLMIMQNVWNYNFDPQTNIVDVLICRLRNKIEEGFATSVIRTVRGVGYMFTPDRA